MKYIQSINEYVKNPKNAQYLFERLKIDIKNLKLNTEITYREFKSDRWHYNLKIYNVLNLETKRLENLLNRYKNIFEREELHFTYKEKGYTNTEGIFVYSYDCIIKSDRIKRVKPPRYVYHTTKSYRRDKIMQNGLLPSLGDWSIDLSYKPAIFVTSDIFNTFHDYTNEDVDLWEIDTKHLSNIWWSDLNINTLAGGSNDDYIMTYEPIPPEHLKLSNKKPR